MNTKGTAPLADANMGSTIGAQRSWQREDTCSSSSKAQEVATAGAAGRASCPWCSSPRSVVAAAAVVAAAVRAGAGLGGYLLWVCDSWHAREFDGRAGQQQRAP